MECFWTWQSSSLVVVDDVVLRCRWWFIKSCHLHISVTQEWLFGELETKFHFSADCLRVEGAHTRPLVRLVVVRCQNCTLTAAKPSPGVCEDDIPKNDLIYFEAHLICSSYNILAHTNYTHTHLHTAKHNIISIYIQCYFSSRPNNVMGPDITVT